MGECPDAEVVLREGFQQKVKTGESLTHLRAFVDRGSLHKRAIRTRIHFVDALPKTSVGKLDKKRLRAQVTANLAAAEQCDEPVC